MGKADALSRMTGLETGVNDNKDIILLKPDLFVRSLNLFLTTHPGDDITVSLSHYRHMQDKGVQLALERR